MSNQQEAQKLVTEAVIDLVEFDFTSIGGTAKVYIASSLQDGIGPQTGQQVKYVWDGNSYEHVDFNTSGLASDLTGGVIEPTLTVAADSLWAIAAWPNLSLINYRGVVVKRRRLFENETNAIQPQTFYIKKVESLNSTEVTFVLTPSRSFEQLNRKSARTLEL